MMVLPRLLMSFNAAKMTSEEVESNPEVGSSKNKTSGSATCGRKRARQKKDKRTRRLVLLRWPQQPNQARPPYSTTSTYQFQPNVDSFSLPPTDASFFNRTHNAVLNMCYLKQIQHLIDVFNIIGPLLF